MTLACPLVRFEMLLCMAILCILLSQPGQQTTANVNVLPGPRQPSLFLKLISSKHQTTTRKVKPSNQNPVLTAELSQDSTSSNQSLSVPAKPSLPLSHRLSGDASSSPSPPNIKVVISDTCVHRNVQGHETNQTGNQGQEITLEQGSPLILTQKINLVPASCSESCGAQFMALQARLEKLEKEMSILRKKYNGADDICCPSLLCEDGECLNDCSDQGRCEKGKCICFPGFRGPDCSSVTCPSNCHERGACVDGQCVCEKSFTGPDCSIKTCPNDCSNRGRCVQGTCQCDTGFSGIDCADKPCPGNCNNRGRCLKGRCLCHPGFTGLDCSKCEAGVAGAQCVSVFPDNTKRPVIKVNVETVRMKVEPGTDRGNRKAPEKTKLDKAILSQTEEENLKAQRKLWKEKVSGGKDDSNKTRADFSLKEGTEKSTSKKLVFISSATKSRTNTESEMKSDSVQPDKSRDSDLKANTVTEKTATNTSLVKKLGAAKSPTKENTGAGSMSGHKTIAIKSLHITNSTRIFQGQKKSEEVLPKQPEGGRQEGATKLDSKLDMKQEDKGHFKFGVKVKVGGKQDSANINLAKADKFIYQNETKSSDSAKQIKTASKEKMATEQTVGMSEARKECTEQIISYSTNKTKNTEKKPFKRYQIINGTTRQSRTDTKGSVSQCNITAIKHKPGSGVRTDVIQSNKTVVQPREPQRNISILKDGRVFGAIDKLVKLQKNITGRDGSQSGFSRAGIIQANGTTDKSTAPQRNITVAKFGEKSTFSQKELIHTNGTTEKPTKPQRNDTILVRGSGFQKPVVIQVNETTDKASEVRRNITIFKGNQGTKYRRTGVIHTNGTGAMPKEPQRNITAHKDSQKSIVKKSDVQINGMSEKAKEAKKNITIHRESQGYRIEGLKPDPKNEISEKAKEARRNTTVFTESPGFSQRHTSVIPTNETVGKLKEPVRNITVLPGWIGSADSSSLAERNKTVKSNMKTGSVKAGVFAQNKTNIDKTQSQGNDTSLSRGEAGLELKGERSINRTVLLKTASEKKPTSAGQMSETLHRHHTGQFPNGTQQRGPQRPSEDLQHRQEPLKSKGRPTEVVREKNDTQAGGSHVVTDRNSTSRGRQRNQEARGNITTAQLDLVSKMNLYSVVRKKNSSSTQTSYNVTSSHPVDSTKVSVLSKHKTGINVQTNSSIISGKRTLLSLGSVRVQNITSRGFILTWEAPRGKFKNFTVATRENGAERAQEMEEEEAEDEDDEEEDGEKKSKSEDASSQTNISQVGKDKHSARRSEDVINRGSNNSATAYTSEKPRSRATVRDTGSKIRKLSVVPGSTRLLTVRNLRPQTRYSLSLYGTSPGVRSRIHHLTVTTAPEPPIELLFSNVTDSSLSVSWTKPRNPVTGFKITYTNTESGKPISLEVDPQHSSVALSQLLPGSSYDVNVTAQYGLDHSDPIKGLVVTVPDPPTALKAVNVTDTRAVLRWVPALAAVDRYIIVHGSESGAKVTTTVSGDVAELQLKGLRSATEYTVTATSQQGSLRSTTVNLTFTTTGGKRFLQPMDCSQQLLNGMLHSGMAQIFPGSKQDEGVQVYCDMETDGGGWTVFQRRMNGKTNFFRNWEQYSKGFGNLSEEFWLGNELIHSLTSSRPMVLRVDLRAGAETAFATYSSFYIGPQRKHYAVRLSGYSGTAGDSMKYHNGQPFSTRDRDSNSVLSGCARSYRGGWWYKDCHEANLNGLYDINTNHQGVIWTTWKGRDFSIPFTEMKLRPVTFNPQTQG